MTEEGIRTVDLAICIERLQKVLATCIDEFITANIVEFDDRSEGLYVKLKLWIPGPVKEK